MTKQQIIENPRSMIMRIDLDKLPNAEAMLEELNFDKVERRSE